MDSLQIMGCYQKKLSQAQAVPLIGPLLVSPVKAVVSLEQIIGGVAMTAILGSVGVITQNNWFIDKAVEGFDHVGQGVCSYSYAVINVCTFGIAGAVIEFGPYIS